MIISVIFHNGAKQREFTLIIRHQLQENIWMSRDEATEVQQGQTQISSLSYDYENTVSMNRGVLILSISFPQMRIQYNNTDY